MPDNAETRRALIARQRKMALQMSRGGASMESIAERLGVTRGQARKMVTREVKDFADTGAANQERRLVHVEALMELWRTLYTPACAGDYDAIDRFLRVEERLSRLLALDLADQPFTEIDGIEGANGDGERSRFTRSTP